MVNINSKEWHKLRITDIQALLKEDDDETFFFEYKSDDVSNKKVVEEISAFANTYGGYILLGIDDDKNISGCKTWNEQRIHTLIHDSITPIPNFDIKKFKTRDNLIIFVIRIEEGDMPPYITNGGKIYERVSSGSFPVKDYNKLIQLYYKRDDQYKKIENKINIETIKQNNTLPSNFCGYFDMGFSVNLRDSSNLKKLFFDANLENISEILKENYSKFNVTRVGYSIIASLGECNISMGDKKVLSPSSMHNFIEIMSDGSAKFRIIINSEIDSDITDICNLILFTEIFKKIYKSIFEEDFSKNFISAYKYEKLAVLKQFAPTLRIMDENHPFYEKFKKYEEEHTKKYGRNLIISSNRIPINDYIYIDKMYLDKLKIKYNSENIIDELFYTENRLLGYIDKFPKIEEE